MLLSENCNKHTLNKLQPVLYTLESLLEIAISFCCEDYLYKRQLITKENLCEIFRQKVALALRKSNNIPIIHYNQKACNYVLIDFLDYYTKNVSSMRNCFLLFEYKENFCDSRYTLKDWLVTTRVDFNINEILENIPYSSFTSLDAINLLLQS